MWMQDCDHCAVAKLGGLQTWMRHLTDEHVLPTEWPSERAARLTGPNSLKPYTTITESKKKRRKDSIPRPLNSFMLFAQHIRRNVLRIFSDASNSVISQQLGDLWRTVPRTYRNQYDIEANRLVKIHQMEFPNYKYQPKKRQVIFVTNASENYRSNNNLHSNRDTETYSNRMGNVAAIKPANDYSQYNGLSTGKPNQANKNRASPNLNLRRTASAAETKCEITNNTGNQFSLKRSITIDSGNQRSSPMKQNPITVHSRLEPKSFIHTNNPNSLFKPVTTSLSSVLPPLLTTSQSNCVSTEVFSVSTCDSAYASGINSSSSSSASSPAVGELVSPAKSQSGINNNPKSSPVCRKIQFIPIRPQSQHLLPVGAQPMRQRFLSATNGSSLSSTTNQVGLNVKAKIEKHHFYHSNEIEMQDQAAESILLHESSTSVQELLTPVYIQLDSDRCATTEGVMLALPPGTTILHTNSGATHIPIHTVPSQSTRRLLVANGCKLSTSGSRSIQVLQPVKIMNVITTQGSSISESQLVGQIGSDTSSPFQYSSNSSPSAYSPQTSDIYLPTQQQQSYQHASNSIPCTRNNLTNQCFQTNSSLISKNMMTYQNHSLSSTTCRSSAVKVPYDAENKDVFDDVIHMDCCIDDSKDLTTSSAISSLISDWSSPMSSVDHCEIITSVNDDCMFNSHPNSTLPPLTVDVLRPGRDSISSCPVVESDPSPSSEFQMPGDDHFDSSFDAMMNSIDITTFLPGTFPTSEDQIDVEFDQELRQVGSSFLEENTLLKSGDSEQTLKFITTNDLRFSQDEGIFGLTTEACDSNSGNRIFELQPSLQLPQSTKHQTTLHTQAAPTVRMNAFHDILNITPQVFSTTLSDLETLDKSNLFVLKPDWSIIA